MGTDIAGDMAKSELVAANNEIRTIFNGQIPGYFNSRRAKYNLESWVSTEGTFIHLDAECYGDLKDFFEPEKLKYWERFYRNCQHGHLLQDIIARAFPYHGVVIANHPLYSSYWDAKRKRILRGLEKLGYAVGEKKSSSYAHNWGQETKRELLRVMRQEGIVDPRLKKILDMIRENIGADSYTFAHYKPSTKRNLHFNDYHHFQLPEHKTVIHVFELPEERLESFQGFYTSDLSQYGNHPAIRTAAGIASPVQTRQGKRHIPMIDFCDRATLAGVEFDLAKLGMHGMIVESGNSFHFYGFETLSEDDWRSFVEETRGFRSIDKNWPDLQLEQGYSMLRITPAYHRLFQPCIVRKLEPAEGFFQTSIGLAA